VACEAVHRRSAVARTTASIETTQAISVIGKAPDYETPRPRAPRGRSLANRCICGVSTQPTPASRPRKMQQRAVPPISTCAPLRDPCKWRRELESEPARLDSRWATDRVGAWNFLGGGGAIGRHACSGSRPICLTIRVGKRHCWSAFA
jgi:hypothetical protein